MTIVRPLATVLLLPTSVVGTNSFKIWYQLGQGPVGNSSSRGVLLPEFGLSRTGRADWGAEGMTTVIFLDGSTISGVPRPRTAVGSMSANRPVALPGPTGTKG